MPHRFPQEAVLRDGRRVLLRPFAKRDVSALHDLFQRLPEETRRFAWDRVGERATIERWGRELDYEKVFPLLALDGSRRWWATPRSTARSRSAAATGRIKWTIDPAYRGVGLGSLLVNHFIDTARGIGLKHLNCMLITDLEDDAVRVLADLGFRRYEIPGYGVDPDGNAHDMTLLVLAL